MNVRTTDPETADHNTVMSWLQDREMKDHKLADARRGVGGRVFIATVISRMQEKAYAAFPNIDRSLIDAFVEQYMVPRR